MKNSSKTQKHSSLETVYVAPDEKTAAKLDRLFARVDKLKEDIEEKEMLMDNDPLVKKYINEGKDFRTLSYWKTNIKPLYAKLEKAENDINKIVDAEWTH